MNELSIMLTLLVERIGAISIKLVSTSHPLPLAHVVGRHPRPVSYTHLTLPTIYSV